MSLTLTSHGRARNGPAFVSVKSRKGGRVRTATLSDPYAALSRIDGARSGACRYSTEFELKLAGTGLLLLTPVSRETKGVTRGRFCPVGVHL